MYQPAGFPRILESHGKSWNLDVAFSRPGKSWKLALVMESHGKVGISTTGHGFFWQKILALTGANVLYACGLTMGPLCWVTYE